MKRYTCFAFALFCVATGYAQEPSLYGVGTTPETTIQATVGESVWLEVDSLSLSDLDNGAVYVFPSGCDVGLRVLQDRRGSVIVWFCPHEAPPAGQFDVLLVAPVLDVSDAGETVPSLKRLAWTVRTGAAPIPPPTPPPTPDPTVRGSRIVVIRESADATPAESALLLSLRNESSLSSRLTILDKDSKDETGNPSPLVKLCLAGYSAGLPGVFVVGERAGAAVVVYSEKLPATVEQVKAIWAKARGWAMTIEIGISNDWIDVEPDWDTGWCEEEERDAMCGLPYYEDIFADQLIPRSDWDDVIAALGSLPETLVTHIKNQGREGSCVGNGAAAAFEQVWNNQFGIENEVRISAMSLYKRIGRSAGSGAMVKDALTEGGSRGFLPEDTPTQRTRFQHTHDATGFSGRLPSGWETTAAQFCFDPGECYRVGTFQGAVTAVSKHFNWVYGRKRHCICGLKVVKSNRRYYMKYRNSWGNWGDGGYGYDSESILYERAISYGSFVVRGVIVPSWMEDGKL